MPRAQSSIQRDALHKVFGKLGISSRNQLKSVLAGGNWEGA
jgi:hypothetical protein